MSTFTIMPGPFDFGFSSGILFPMLGKDTSVSSPKPRSAVSSPYRFGSLLSPMFGKTPTKNLMKDFILHALLPTTPSRLIIATILVVQLM